MASEDIASVGIGGEENRYHTSHSNLPTSSEKSRVMLLLPDGFDYRLTHRYLDSMPNARRIMEQGYSGQILPFASTWGNINFASLITGAPPGTPGVSILAQRPLPGRLQ